MHFSVKLRKQGFRKCKYGKADINLSPNFTIEDIHKLREYNYEMTKGMTEQERMDLYNREGWEVHR